jgi:hypothetical protein
MVDFDKLVLGPASKIFQIKVRFTPLVSDPGAPAFDLWGVYSSSPVDVQMQDETIFSDQQTSLGIRKRDFLGARPDRGDLVEITDTTHIDFGKRFWVGDSDDDGQGGSMLMLRTHNPAPVDGS